jgi:hypothetical protein
VGVRKVAVLQVPRQCLLVLLLKIGWQEGKKKNVEK